MHEEEQVILEIGGIPFQYHAISKGSSLKNSIVTSHIKTCEYFYAVLREEIPTKT